jgi:hypothetical protein
MDIDGCVERFGWKLGFETKEGDAPIKWGQRINLESLALDGWTIVILRAKRAQDVAGFDVWHGNTKVHYDGDADRLIEFCRNWFDFASRHRHEPIYWRRLNGTPDLFQHQLSPLETVRLLFQERLSYEEQRAFLAEVLAQIPPF